jgi:hypothetical protein
MAIHIEDGEYTLHQPDAAGPEVGQLVVVDGGLTQHWFLYTAVPKTVPGKQVYQRPSRTTIDVAINLAFAYKGPTTVFSPADATTRIATLTHDNTGLEVQYITGDCSGRATTFFDPQHLGDIFYQVDPWIYYIFQEDPDLPVGWLDVVEDKFKRGVTTESWGLCTDVAKEPGAKMYTSPGKLGGAYAIKALPVGADLGTFPKNAILGGVTAVCTSH